LAGNSNEVTVDASGDRDRLIRIACQLHHMCGRYNEEHVGNLKEYCRAYLTHMWSIRDNHSDSAFPSTTGYGGRDSRIDRALKVLAISHAVLLWFPSRRQLTRPNTIGPHRMMDCSPRDPPLILASAVVDVRGRAALTTARREGPGQL
jgi:hypothetical protein